MERCKQNNSRSRRTALYFCMLFLDILMSTVLLPTVNIKHVQNKSELFKLHYVRWRCRGCDLKFLPPNPTKRWHFVYSCLSSPQHSPVGLLPLYNTHRSRQQERLTCTMLVMYVMPACSWLAQRLSCVWPMARGAFQHLHAKVRARSRSTSIIAFVSFSFWII